jgi:hypothetical protein
MNERIKDLAKQAVITVQRKKANQIYGGPSVAYESKEFSKEKFAELIIKECAEICSAIDNGNPQEGTHNPAAAIYRRFGVE